MQDAAHLCNLELQRREVAQRRRRRVNVKRGRWMFHDVKQTQTYETSQNLKPPLCLYMHPVMEQRSVHRANGAEDHAHCRL
ncbi:hypothetical protein INR49_008761 [Caranx melampygus]|nr:hypothetical protein INR49_008761 [Caranx melampygus]